MLTLVFIRGILDYNLKNGNKTMNEKLNSILNDRKTIVDDFEITLNPWDRMLRVKDPEIYLRGFSEYMAEADRKVRSYEKAYR